MAGGPTVSEDLEPLIDRLSAEHETLLGLLNEHRIAIRTADGPALDRLAQAEAGTLGRIEVLNQRRVAMAGGDSATLAQLAQLLPEPRKSEVLAKAGQLRGLIERTRAAQRTVQVASQSVMNHLRGLMGQVGQRLSHTGTYGRDGAVRSGAAVVTGLDVRL